MIYHQGDTLDKGEKPKWITEHDIRATCKTMREAIDRDFPESVREMANKLMNQIQDMALAALHPSLNKKGT